MAGTPWGFSTFDLSTEPLEFAPPIGANCKLICEADQPEFRVARSSVLILSIRLPRVRATHPSNRHPEAWNPCQRIPAANPGPQRTLDSSRLSGILSLRSLANEKTTILVEEAPCSRNDVRFYRSRSSPSA